MCKFIRDNGLRLFCFFLSVLSLVLVPAFKMRREVFPVPVDKTYPFDKKLQNRLISGRGIVWKRFSGKD